MSNPHKKQSRVRALSIPGKNAEKQAKNADFASHDQTATATTNHAAEAMPAAKNGNPFLAKQNQIQPDVDDWLTADIEADIEARSNDPLPEPKRQAEGAQAGQEIKPLELLPASTLFDLPPLEWWIWELLPKVGVVLLYGESMAGKSFVALDLLATLAEKRQWQGVDTERPDCLVYISLESGRGVANRVEAWQNHYQRKFPDNVLFYVKEWSVDEIDNLLAAIPEYSVVICDTLSRCTSGYKENDNDEMEKALAQFRRIAMEKNSLCILVHHTGKNGQTERGAYVLTANVDGKIKVSCGSEDTRYVEFEKVKEAESGRVFQFTLDQIQISNDHKGRLRTSCYVNQLGEREAKIFSKPETTGPKGIKGANWTAYKVFVELWEQSQGQAIYAKDWQKPFYEKVIVKEPPEDMPEEERQAKIGNNKRTAFKRAKEKLCELNLLTGNNDFFKLVTSNADSK